MKSVLVQIGRAVKGSDASGREAVRIAVGLTLGDNRVTVAFTGPAVRALCGARGELLRYVKGLELVKARILAGGESLDRQGDPSSLRPGVEVIDEKTIGQMAAACDVYIPFLENKGVK